MALPTSPGIQPTPKPRPASQPQILTGLPNEQCFHGPGLHVPSNKGPRLTSDPHTHHKFQEVLNPSMGVLRLPSSPSPNLVHTPSPQTFPLPDLP